MPGPKTNERPGTRASVRNVRGSASKARRVLDLIRNESVEDALSILKFSETGVSETVMKVLNSAIANAEHNDNIPADELFVAACYADEGPTMKRFRPRARGRASRINKRTSHITIIVARYEAEELDARRARATAAGTSSAAQAEARRRRVAKSKDEEAAAEDIVEETVTEEVVEETVDTAAAATAAGAAVVTDAVVSDDYEEDAVEVAVESGEEEE